jgi:hypothetical protein
MPKSSAIMVWSLSDRQLCFADGRLFAQQRPPSNLARFFKMFAFPQLLGYAAALEELLEAAQSHSNRFAVVDAHSQRHHFSLLRVT